MGDSIDCTKLDASLMGHCREIRNRIINDEKVS